MPAIREVWIKHHNTITSMALFEMTGDEFRPLPSTRFADMRVRERGDLQRLLRSQIKVLDEELHVLSEEFGDWEDSRRRIDLLAIDKQANLVVIELKRTNDGGHMELQAIRYAAMVSTMTFARAAEVHAEFLARLGLPPETARDRILKFLEWDEPDEEHFAPDVRILLASEDFSKELTTAVLWLREREIDIRCVRLRPFMHGETILVDVQQLIPLPEAAEYQIQLRKKEQVGRRERAETSDVLLRFWEKLVALARERGTRHANIAPGDRLWLGASSGVRGLNFNYGVVRNHALVELYIDRGDAAENKRIFDEIQAAKTRIEATFGRPFLWERLDEGRACRIKYEIEGAGYRSQESQWQGLQTEMVDAMIKLEAAMRPSLEALRL